jgi:hypothetical protein
MVGLLQQVQVEVLALAQAVGVPQGREAQVQALAEVQVAQVLELVQAEAEELE